VGLRVCTCVHVILVSTAVESLLTLKVRFECCFVVYIMPGDFHILCTRTFNICSAKFPPLRMTSAGHLATTNLFINRRHFCSPLFICATFREKFGSVNTSNTAILWFVVQLYCARVQSFVHQGLDWPPIKVKDLVSKAKVIWKPLMESDGMERLCLSLVQPKEFNVCKQVSK